MGRNLLSLFSCFRKANGNRLLPAFHFFATAALERTFLPFVHGLLNSFLSPFAIPGHYHRPFIKIPLETSRIHLVQGHLTPMKGWGEREQQVGVLHLAVSECPLPDFLAA